MSSAGQVEPASVTIIGHSDLFYWWPVWAVGFLEAGWVLWEAPLLPLAVLLVLVEGVFVWLVVDFPGVVALVLGAGFFVVVAAGGGVSACFVTPPAENGATIAAKKTTTTIDRTLLPMVAIATLSIQPTSPL